jgi:hypothetical protein
MEKTQLILIWKVLVGQLPKLKAEQHLKEFKEKFEANTCLPEYVKCVYIPIFIGETNIEMVPLHSVTNIQEINELLGDEKEQLVNLRISKVEKSIMQQKAKNYGFKNLSEYLRFVGLNANVEVSGKEK